MNASLHRTWGNFKAILCGGNQSLLDTAKQDGFAAMKVYNEALGKKLPLPVSTLLSTQSAQIQLLKEYMATVHYLGE